MASHPATIANRETVFEACEELHAKKVFPSNLQIREHLGGGSMYTISKYQREWLSQNKSDSGSLPMEFKTINSAFEQLRLKVFECVEQVINHEQIAITNAENERLKVENEQLKNQLETVKIVQAELMTKIESLNNRSLRLN